MSRASGTNGSPARKRTRYRGSIFAIRRVTQLALAGACVLGAASATASDTEGASSPQATIETRQAGFKRMGAAMKAIVAQLKTDAPDNTQIATAAQAIRTGSESVPHWFPAGSGAEAGSETDALPYIWQERAKFDSLATRLVAESKTLATAASGGDVVAVKSQVKVVAEVCASCHRSFRAD
ncbi:MAG: cytochrome c [Gammaproteobacteria bacterium]